MVNLRAPDEATAQRVSSLIEEAVRTAMIDGDMPGRVVVIRDLDLAAIPAPATPARIASLVDAAVARIATDAVHGNDPAAAMTPVIYFENEAAVVVSLAQRVAANKPATEWFWPSVVKGWTPNMPAERAIPLLIERAMATSSGVPTLARVVDLLASTGVLDKLLERLSPSDGRALLEAIGWTEEMTAAVAHDTHSPASTLADAPEPTPFRHPPPPTSPTALSSDDTRPPQMPARSESLVQRWIARWSGDEHDPRGVWLGAMLLVADQPERSKSAQLPEIVRMWLASVVEQTRAEMDAEARGGVSAQLPRRDDLIADARAWWQSHPRSPVDSLFGGGPPFPFRPGAAASDPNAVERRAHDAPPHSENRDLVDPPVWKAPRATDHAGLLFLIPLLTRTGVANIVANDPGLTERRWADALLLRLARRLGVPFDDPAVAWITTHPVTIAHADRALTAEVFRAARIRLRMEAGCTMRRLVQHSGAIVARPAEIDVLLQPFDDDGASRRLAFDRDPTWVPWLARTLSFQHLAGLDVDA